MPWNFGKLGIGVTAALSIFACRCPAMAGNLTNGRLQSIAAARAMLAKNEALAWHSVITADRRELTDLRNASIAAMRAENAQSVVVIQKLINAATRRLSGEESGPPFPPGFNTSTGTLRCNPIIAEAEKHRIALVAAAEARLVKAENSFRQTVLAADRNVIAQLHARVNAAMKALDAKAVVLDMHRLKLAKLQLKRDSSMRPGGAPVGTASTFMGFGGNATRVVYIIDHSGLMLYNFEFVAHELQKSTMQLAPTQRFAVIVVSRKARLLGKPTLTHATSRAKELFSREFSNVHPAGAARGRLAVYENAFRVAFQLHPQIVYFITNGGFDPSLAEAVKRMDTHGAHVFTCTFLNGNSRRFTSQLKLYSGALKEMAKETGGQYRLVTERAGTDRKTVGLANRRGSEPGPPPRSLPPASPQPLRHASFQGAGVGGGGSIVTPPPNPIMPLKYQFAWPAHLVNPKFQLTIRRDGTVANVKVLISSGHAGIDQAIINALMQARFLPNIVGGKPVQSKFVIRYQLAS